MWNVWKKPNKALVTGTGSGIGLALARRLIFMGYEVYGIGRTLAPELEDHLPERRLGRRHRMAPPARPPG